MLRAMTPTPAGTVTFLFTDIQGSTKLWEKHPSLMGRVIARHDDLIRDAAAAHGGYVFKTVGDAVCMAFETVRDALVTAISIQREILAQDWGEAGRLLVRMGMHTGSAELRAGDYFGPTLNRVARIESAGHGGQILVSNATFELIQDEGLEGVVFKPLGEHRLRSLERPENLFQVTAEGLLVDFPPPRSMESLPNNLPVQATSFIGREKEMEDVRRLLEKTRLLTLTGTGGTGKTRLAIEAGARQISEFRDGVWLVELAPVNNPDQLVPAVAAAVGAREDPEVPIRDTLVSFCRGKSLLIILDNCEHVQEAAAALAGDLLRSCPNVRLLATSRHSLGIGGETTFQVPPLAIFDTQTEELQGPDLAERMSQYEAVKLFIARAVSVRPGFAVTNANAPAVAEICSRLDGIPLAIELAAARVRLLDVEQIAARLGDRFRLLRSSDRTMLPHQQTLQALIDWSYDILSDPERRLFRRMGVFAGGRSIEGIEAVCSGDGVDEIDILDLLQLLVDKSLVMVETSPAGERRYTLIESVWHYARARLDEAGELGELRSRHLAFYLKLAETAAPHLEGPEQKLWIDRLSADLFNLRHAVDFAIGSGRVGEALRILSATYRVVEVRGTHLRDAAELFARALASPVDSVAPSHLAYAHVSAGRIAWARDAYVEARDHFEVARRISETLADKSGIALCDMLIAFIARGDMQADESRARFESALALSREAGNDYVESGSLSGLGSLALDQGDFETARRLKDQAVTLSEERGDRWISGLFLWGVARVAVVQHDVPAALETLANWARIINELGSRWMYSYLLECYAETALVSGALERSARLFGAAEAAREHFDTKFSAREAAEHETSVSSLRSRLTPELLREAWESGRNTPLPDAVAEALNA